MRDCDALSITLRHAEHDVAAYREAAPDLPHLPLAHFSDAGVRSLLFRRLLLRAPLVVRLLQWLACRANLGHRLAGFVRDLTYWDRVRRLVSRDEWGSLVQGPVILMYHAIGQPGERASRYVLPGRTFRRQVGWLKARGYHLMSLQAMVRARRARRAPPHTVVISFDDGYQDNALALLTQRVPATVFVVTAAMGDVNRWDDGGALKGRTLLSWDVARSLLQCGVEIGGHSRSHPRLPEVSHERLTEEVAGALADLQAELGPGAYTFAYPHGRFDLATQAAVQGAGYIAAACSRGGVNDPRVSDFELCRVEVKGTDSFVSFVLMTWLGRRITLWQFMRSLLFG